MTFTSTKDRRNQSIFLVETMKDLQPSEVNYSNFHFFFFISKKKEKVESKKKNTND